METAEHTVREHAYHLWNQGGRSEELSLEFWLAAKAEFDRIENPLWLTEEAAAARRTPNLLEESSVRVKSRERRLAGLLN